MKLLVLIFTVMIGVSARPQGYSLLPPSGPSFAPLTPRRCNEGQVLHVDGRCVTPRVNRRVFLYDVPRIPTPSGPPLFIPAPTVETNLLFIRTPEGGQGPDPIVVPPPQQQHVVYVLNKQSEGGQKVIHVPAPPSSDPDVYFVNYAEGENPVLPSGVDLQTALNAASVSGGQSNGDLGDITSITAGSNNGFGINNGFGSFVVDDGIGSISDLGFGNGFRSNGFLSSTTLGLNNGFGINNGIVGNDGLGGNSGFESSISLGGNNGFGTSSRFDGSIGALGISNGFGLNGGSITALPSNGHVSPVPQSYRTP
ncbi:uncharacterized protein LOC119587248 [Penaeus monodon]|uniref:uncharacterized protein LOC119587248 n=1 Tax=Penaeus monodon TaxID=6687 RepID=UPI0018A7738B|nr:uncharacterized protein LOC119587248 [Penaeus monodon]